MGATALAFLVWVPLTAGKVDMEDPTMVKAFPDPASCLVQAEKNNRTPSGPRPLRRDKTEQVKTKQVWFCLKPIYPT
jgi:hypothetical protein